MKSTNNAAEPELSGLFSSWLVCSAVGWLQLSQHSITELSVPIHGPQLLGAAQASAAQAGAEGGQDGTSSLALRM